MPGFFDANAPQVAERPQDGRHACDLLAVALAVALAAAGGHTAGRVGGRKEDQWRFAVQYKVSCIAVHCPGARSAKTYYTSKRPQIRSLSKCIALAARHGIFLSNDRPQQEQPQLQHAGPFVALRSSCWYWPSLFSSKYPTSRYSARA